MGAEDIAPSFIKKPQLRQEDDGNRLIFECQLLSRPKPDIEWYRSDNLVIEDERTKFKIQPIDNNQFTVVLELDDVIETDAGLYKVKAKNKSGEVSASINLNFTRGRFSAEEEARQIDGFAPTFAKKPSIRQEDDGKRLLFECRVNADPKPTITWFHNGTVVKESTRHKISMDKDGHSYFATLEVKNVTVEDAGKYKVNGKNELGESNATISLNFDSDEAPVPEDGIKPTFTERPVIRQSEDGGNVTFECRCVGDPKPGLTWYHAQKELKEGGRYKMALTLDQKLYHMASLEIRNVVSSDQGEYRVMAKNKHGEGVATINLNFEGSSKKIPDGKSPRFPKKPTIRQEEDILIMECILEAHPVPDITWYRGDSKIDNSARIKMSRKATSKDNFILTLEIENPAKDDGGNYRCNAFNIYGESNANIALNFQGANDANGFSPSFVEKPRIIPNDSGTLITMKCKCKAKPKPTVIWYRDQEVVNKSKKIDIKTTVIAEDTYELTLEIKDPSASDGGTYRCNVQNEYGESNANLNLNIEAEPEPEGEGPTFVQKPRIVSENNGKLVIMECKIKADPKPDIVWYCNGEVVKESNKLKMSTEQRGDQYYVKLELIDPQLEDSGLYKCNIKNILGELNANLTLNIEIVPVIKEKPRIIKIIKKRTVVIECTVTSKFEPKCTWVKESDVVKESHRHVYLIEKTKEGEFAVKLEINEVEDSDKGAYKLIARNEKGEVVSQIVNLVDIPKEERKPSKPEITRPLVDQNVTEGKTLELLIMLKQSDRKCKIEWYKGSTLIKDTKEITTTFDGTTSRLTLSSARIEHSATYKVIVSNEVGKDESTCKIVITKGKQKKKEEEEAAEVKRKKEEEEEKAKAVSEEENVKKAKEEKARESMKIKIEESKKRKAEEEKGAEDIRKTEEKEKAAEAKKKKVHEEDRKKIEENKKNEEEKKNAKEAKEQKAEEKKKVKEPKEQKADEEKEPREVKEQKAEQENRRNANEEKMANEENQKATQAKKKSEEKIIPEDKKKAYENKKVINNVEPIVDGTDNIPEERELFEQIGLKKAEPRAQLQQRKASAQEEIKENRSQSITSTTSMSSRRSSLDVEDTKSESLPTSVIQKKTLEKVQNKNLQANKFPQQTIEEIPKLKPTDKKRIAKVTEEQKPSEELPKLRKTSVAQSKDEPKPEPVKPKTKSKAKHTSKYDELPEIPDYERPVLEKFEKPEFEASDFTRQLEIPNKMEKPVFESDKPQPQQVEYKNGLPKKEAAVIKSAEEPRGFKVEKGKIPEEANDKDSATLRPVIIEPQDDKPKVPKVQPPAPGEPPKIEVIREKRPSLAPEPQSRRGSLIPPDTGRRPSLIINDELLRPGEVGDGQKNKPRPGEMGDSKQVQYYFQIKFFLA